jgi:hypothetical protein
MTRRVMDKLDILYISICNLRLHYELEENFGYSLPPSPSVGTITNTSAYMGI